jgi:hypothetical protein
MTSEQTTLSESAVKHSHGTRVALMFLPLSPHRLDAGVYKLRAVEQTQGAGGEGTVADIFGMGGMWLAHLR